MATELRHALRRWNFAAVWTSPLSRASETCALSGYGERAELRTDLMEWDYGTFEGKTRGEIRATSPNWTIWADGVPCGETARDVGTRADRVIAQARAVGGDVLLFSHGHLLRVLAARWLELPPTEGRLFALSTASISVLGFDGDGDQPVLQLWNDTTHLRR